MPVHRPQHMRAYVAIAVAMLSLLLAACASSASTSQPTATANHSVAVPTSAATATAAGPVGTAGPGVEGTADLCTATPAVSAVLPTSIPGYPGAALRIGQAHSGSGLFGFCTSDSVATVVSFYQAHLPGSGWQQVTVNTIATTQQLSATQSSTHLVITVAPDAALSGTTSVIIQTTAQ